MQTVLIAGAGRSSAWLIKYMLKKARNQWRVIVMDSDEELIHEKLNRHPKGQTAVVDIHNSKERQKYVQQADIVLSLMPHDLHLILAKDCLKFKKHLITPSYISEDMQALDEEARKAGLLFMCEMGLDPGIDHMVAASLIQGIHRIAGVVTSFKTACGGLIDKASDDNPWHYKMAWNPRNIVLAGCEGASWLENGMIKKIGYHEVFENPAKVKIPSQGTLASYPNRDALKYRQVYQINYAQTIERTTLRHPEFIKGWDYIVKAGLTDSGDSVEAEELTYAGWVASKTGLPDDNNLIHHFKEKFKVDAKVMNMLEWMRLFEPRLINKKDGLTSAAILQGLLERRWKMRAVDKDVVVMRHELEYDRRGSINKVTATMVATGEDRMYSAMAKTVGLPMGILACRILNGQTDAKRLAGVQIPVMQEVFAPVLRELSKQGIKFTEELTP